MINMNGGAWLGAWLALERRSQAWLAGRLGVTQAAVSRLVVGSSRPGLGLAMKLRTACGIPLEAWLTIPELLALDRLERNER